MRLEEGEVGYPKPLFSDVIIRNPITDELMATIDSKISKLPEKEREEYLRSNLKDLWAKVEIIEVGSDCRSLKKGDIGMASHSIASHSVPTPDGKFLIVPERMFKAVW